MKKLAALSFLSGIISLASSCVLSEISPNQGSFKQVEEVFDLKEFEAVDLGASFKAVIKPSTKFRVTANGVEKDIDDLNVRVVNKTLRVNYNRGSWIGRIGRDQTELSIEMPFIKAIDLSGACEASIEDFKKAENLEVDISGASQLFLESEVGKINSDISGASTFSVNALSTVINADLSGASKIHAFKADATEAYLSLSGASKANISVSKKLDVEASGASVVNYRGEPEIRKNLSGASKVQKDRE